MAERSPGKDSVTGHWEMAGVILDRAFPTFPDGFPGDVIAEFERRIGRKTLGNKAASGTAIIDELGAEHVRTGCPIVYTSADSVFQIAAHEEVIPIPELYRICEIAYEMVGKGMGVGRVIARPFVGAPGAFTRTRTVTTTRCRRPGSTLLDAMTAAGKPVHAIGKIQDLFAGRGVTTAVHTKSDDEGVDEIEKAIGSAGPGLVFTNLVDFDTQYGHRNDPAGYAANLERFDARLTRLLPLLRERDLLIITADHGNDPTTPSTDHAREYVPVFLVGQRRAARTPTSASARRSPISARRSPRSSASVRSPTAKASFAISCRVMMASRATSTPTIDTAAARGTRAPDPGAAGGQERRHQGAAASRDRGSDPPGASSATATG